MIFARQDLLADPPFSRLDLIICRNLLIYLEAEAQERCISLFHYALKPGGYLFCIAGKQYLLYDAPVLYCEYPKHVCDKLYHLLRQINIGYSED